MRRQSWALVMASNQNSGKGVLFGASCLLDKPTRAKYFSAGLVVCVRLAATRRCFVGMRSAWASLRPAEFSNACVSDARLQNKLKKIDFQEFPATVQTKTTLLKAYLIGLTEIITPWRCPKFRRKKFRRFSKILEHCRGENNDFWQRNHDLHQKVHP